MDPKICTSFNAFEIANYKRFVIDSHYTVKTHLGTYFQVNFAVYTNTHTQSHCTHVDFVCEYR